MRAYCRNGHLLRTSDFRIEIRLRKDGFPSTYVRCVHCKRINNARYMKNWRAKHHRRIA